MSAAEKVNMAYVGQPDLFDSEESIRRRNEGMASVTKEGFSKAVANVVAGMVGRTVTGEDVRAQCLKQAVEPHHANAWGGVVQGLVRSGRLRYTGEHRRMRAIKSHGHETKVYEVMP